MERIEVALEVGPVEPATVERLKADGYAVYKFATSWRVVGEFRPDSGQPVMEQARIRVHDILIDYRLKPLHTPPQFAIRDPDADLDRAAGELILEDARRADDPDPIPVRRRRWWQKQMELGLGERKGD